jgi:hypothetical protein
MAKPLTFLVLNEIGQALEIRPFDQKWTWTNSLQHGTPLDLDEALQLKADILAGDVDEARRATSARIVEDYHRRPAFQSLEQEYAEVERRR